MKWFETNGFDILKYFLEMLKTASKSKPEKELIHVWYEARSLNVGPAQKRQNVPEDQAFWARHDIEMRKASKICMVLWLKNIYLSFQTP